MDEKKKKERGTLVSVNWWKLEKDLHESQDSRRRKIELENDPELREAVEEMERQR